MEQLLIIPHRLPGMNEWAGRASRWLYKKIKADMQGSIEAEIRRQKLKPMPYAAVTCIWFEPNKKRDFDNICSAQKFILDALVKCKVLKGDGWAHVLELSHSFVCLGDGKAAVHVKLTDKV